MATYAADGSKIACPTDGNGNLMAIATVANASPKQSKGSKAPDGSIYFALSDGNGTLV